MSKAELKLVDAATTTKGGGKGSDPARVALAAAISEAAIASKDADAARAAVDRAKEMLRDARKRLEDSAQWVADAKAAQARRLTAAAMSGETLEADRSMRNARDRQVGAEDDVEAATIALASVQEAVAERESTEMMAKRAVAEAARRVLASEIEPALDAVVRLKTEINVAVGRLAFLESKAFADFDRSSERSCLESHLSGLFLDRTSRNPTYAKWADYLAALERDAYAAPPA